MYSKRGQVTLFVIIALVIVVVVVLAIILVPKMNKPKTPGSESINPEAYLDSCYHDELEPFLKVIFLQGGYLEPSPFFTIIENNQEVKMQFLSAQGVIQKPLIEQDIENQLENKMKTITKNCIDYYASGLIEKGNEVTTCNLNSLSLNITLESDRISSNITCPMKITTKDNKVFSFNSFLLLKNSRLYNIISLVRDLINAERTNNIQEVLDLIQNYQLLNPGVLIYREQRTQEDTIYRILYGENKFYFAIRK